MDRTAIEGIPIPEHIRYWRDAAKLSKSQLARECQVTPSAVTRWENGESDPPIATLERIAKACGVELWVFVRPLPVTQGV